MTFEPALHKSASENSDVRFSAAHVNEWRDSGFLLIEDFFRRDEIDAIVDDYERLYGERRTDTRPETPELAGQFNKYQFRNIHMLPYDASVTTNLMSLHPALIELAKALLGVDKVHLYQSHTWAKFTGGANYEQPLHCDFGNHTLTVPSDSLAERTVDFIVYLTDVTDAHGALHYVTKPDAESVLGKGRITAGADQQATLQANEKSAAAPAGALLAHSIDTFHRGTNLTAKHGYRYTMTIGYKAAGNDQIGFHVWQTGAGRDWTPILANGTPAQLECLGIPLPGDPFWTERTLKLTQSRWPQWDMRAYIESAEVSR